MTEPAYIEALKQLDQIRRSATIRVEVRRPHGVPFSLVKAAVKHVGNEEIDQVWCVFDVESPPHPNLVEAVALAERHDVRLAVSNPCFELWLLLHDRLCRAALTTTQAAKLANELAAFDGKTITDVSWFLDRRSTAIKHARELARKHRGDRTGFLDDNPSSGMPGLLEALGRAVHR